MATIDVSDCCLVCADPLEWTGIGVCGHKEICSRCVARMRFVLKDNNCVLCKTESPAVFFTRFMGDYTARVPPEDYPEKLKERERKGELRFCPSVDGYFDDPKHHEQISALCGYTHPILEAAAPLPVPRFTNLADMKRHIETTFKLNFCDICSASRKIFVCEQLLYNRAQLERHNREGDETGPLSQSSFQGHPLCKFCRKRFYDSQELWRHMESAHENCFLCRRSAPDKYVYYRHYKELEDHFSRDHFMCPHPRCMEKKFVVFEAEQEIKRHFAQEHGDELKMSKAQRREAFNVPIQLQYRDGPSEAYGAEDAAAAAVSVAMDRPGVTIGGGQGFTSRHGRNNNGGGGGGGGQGYSAAMHHSRSEPQIQAAIQASVEGGYDDGRDAEAELSSVTFNAADFPRVGGAGSSLRPVGGLWGGAGGSGSSGGLNTEHFPALPTMSKSAKKRLKEHNTSLAQRLSAAAQPPRVVNRAVHPGAAVGSLSASAFPPLEGDGAPSTSAAAPAQRASVPSYPPLSAAPAQRGPAPSYPPLPAAPAQRAPAPSYPPLSPAPATPAAREPEAPTPAGEAWPELPPASTSTTASSSAAPPASQSSSSASAALAARFFSLSTASAPAPPAAQQPQQRAAPPLPAPEDFPDLPMQPRKSKSKAPKPAASSEAAAAAFKAASERGASARAAARGDSGRAAAAAAAPAPSPGEFPSLAQVAVSSAATASSTSRPSASQAAGTPTPAPAAAAAGSVTTGGVSESLKAANRALVDKIRSQLDDPQRFDAFRQDSGNFQRGVISAQEYHEHMVDLGLLSLVAELSSLCPNSAKQSELMAAHSAFLTSPAAHDVQRLSAGWVPPEAALAAAKQAEKNQCWACPRCTLINAPGLTRCEACSFQTEQDEFPSLGAGEASSSSGRQASSVPAGESLGGKGKKAGKSKGTVLNIGMPRQGTGRNAAPQEEQVQQRNAWGQDGAKQNTAALKQQVEQQRQLLAQASANRGAWAQSGGSKLARSIGAVNDAWGSS